MDIFDLTLRPNRDLFFHSYDPIDSRLGSIVRSEPDDYSSCSYVLLGSPQDIGVQRNKGRVGAASAPDAIRSMLYKMAHPAELGVAGFFDLGNVPITGTLEEIHDLQEQIVGQLLIDKKIPIILGGGNDISYPDCKAVSKYFGEVFAINIDNHFDVRLNERRNSGTPYRMLLEEGFLEGKNFIELGCQKPANSFEYKHYLRSKGVDVVYLDQIRLQGCQVVLDQLSDKIGDLPIFWGFDMDSVRASDAPGVSAITPIGLYGEEAIEIARFAGKVQGTRLFEISEVNPEFDIDNRTARLAALMIMHFVTSHLFSSYE